MIGRKVPDLHELTEVDRLIHEPARMAIMAVLQGVESADFKFLLNMTGLTKGNLSAHASKLEAANYISIEKQFRGKLPHTEYRLTKQGRAAFKAYQAKLKWMVQAMATNEER